MRYLFINGIFPQYSQTFVHDQIKMIKERPNAEVSVYAKSKTPFRFEDSVPECSRKLLYSKPQDKRLLCRLVAGVIRRPIQALQLYGLFTRGLIDRPTLRLALQLKHAPDVAITHFGNNYSTAVQLKQHVFPQMKNVVVFHGHDVSSYVEKNGWQNYKSAAPYIDLAIAVNTVWADRLRKNTEIHDVRTIYLGTDISAKPRIRNADEQSYSILFVGRFVEKKGFDVLYEAIKSRITDQHKPLRVHCVGDGPLLEEMQEMIKASQLQDSFVFYGAKQKSFVSQLMSECDLLVAPSRTAQDGDCEGLPVVLMEAMAAGLPVVTTFHSGIPELVTNNERGLLVPEADAEGLSKAIAFAIENPDDMARMALRARAYVVENHDEKRQARIFAEAIA